MRGGLYTAESTGAKDTVQSVDRRKVAVICFCCRERKEVARCGVIYLFDFPYGARIMSGQVPGGLLMGVAAAT